MAYNYIKVADRSTAPWTDVEKVPRGFNDRDFAFADAQGGIFRASAERDLSTERFAIAYMTGSFGATMDHSCSVSGTGTVSAMFESPLLTGTPAEAVDTVLQMAALPRKRPGDTSLLQKLAKGELDLSASAENFPTGSDDGNFAYWLGFIYRCLTLSHGCSSRETYDRHDYSFMKEIYERLLEAGATDLPGSAPEICSRIDMLKGN